MNSIAPEQVKFNTEQAAEYLGLSKNTLSVWRSTGRYNLIYRKIGRKIYYLKEDLDNFINASARTQVK